MKGSKNVTIKAREQLRPNQAFMIELFCENSKAILSGIFAIKLHNGFSTKF